MWLALPRQAQQEPTDSDPVQTKGFFQSIGGTAGALPAVQWLGRKLVQVNLEKFPHFSAAPVDGPLDHVNRAGLGVDFSILKKWKMLNCEVLSLFIQII